MFSESMQMFQVVPRETSLSRNKSSDTTESFASAGWADNLVVNRLPPKAPVAAAPAALFEDDDEEDVDEEDGAIYADDGDTISEIDDEGSYGAQGALEEGLSSELPEDTQILSRMQALLMGEADNIISKKAQQLFAPPKEKKLREKDHSQPQKRVASSRLDHIQSMLGELERKQAGDTITSSNSSGSLSQTERKPKSDHGRLSSQSSNNHRWQVLEAEDNAPTLRRSTTRPMSRRHTETTGARPTSLSHISSLGNEEDDKDAAREIRDKIHAKTASPRRQSLLNVVAPDLPAALKICRRQSVDGHNLDVSSSSRKSALDMENSASRRGMRRHEKRNYSRTPPRIRPSSSRESSLAPSILPESTRTRRSTSREPSLTPSILESVQDDVDSTCFGRKPPIFRGLPVLKEVSFRTSNKNATQQASPKQSVLNQSLTPTTSFSSPLSMLWNVDFFAELKSTPKG